MFYTYLLHHIPTNKFYYGVKYGIKSDPDDFWVRYFTSSKYIHEMIDLYGKDSFEFQIRKTFNTSEKAINWEKKVLRRMKVDIREDFVNKNPGLGYGYASGKKHWAFGVNYTDIHIQNNKNGQIKSPAWSKTPVGHKSRNVLSSLAKKTFTGHKQTEEHINKRKLFGEKNGMFGKHHTDEHKQKISNIMQVKSSSDNYIGTKNLKKSVEERIQNGTHPNCIITECEYCGKKIKSLGNYRRWHGDNCKLKIGG